jgi:hypothetical protein
MWSWLPTLLVIAVTAIALAAASDPPRRARSRRVWTAAIVMTGCLAVASTVWQGQRTGDDAIPLSGSTMSREALTYRERNSPTATYRERNSPTAAPTEQVKALEDRVRELEAGRQVRTIAPAAAQKLTAYLRGFGSHRVIVSCIPDDLEAYLYANQLVTILKAADWDAQGPQATRIFGDVRSPGINFYVSGDGRSDTAKILLDGFATFNIPYRSMVTPNEAIPDAETVELFIGSLPG